MGRTGAAAWAPGVTLLVLTGGSSRRLGSDKASAHVGGRPLLDRLLEQLPADLPVVVVGPRPDAAADDVRFTREDPPGSGPLAGIGAGMALVRTPLVVVLATDMPFAVPVVATVVARLADADPDVAAVIPIDPDGQLQPLSAAYRTDALRRSLAALEPLAGRPVRAMLPALRVMEWPVSGDELADVDTAGDLARARARAAEEGSEMEPMEQWLASVREALGVTVDIDLDAVLDVARDAAHAVERPAAPLTTYLLGAAVAGGADPQEAAATINGLAAEWVDRSQ